MGWQVGANDRMTSVGTCKNLPSPDPKHDKHSDYASGTGGTSCQLCLDIANDRTTETKAKTMLTFAAFGVPPDPQKTGGQTHNSCTH